MLAAGSVPQPAARGEITYRCVVALLLSFTLWSYYEVAQQTGPVITPLTREYTARLAAGHASLSIAPSPQLLALSNPYDPTMNAGYRLMDASLYEGRYYLYFGLTPFATLLVPWFKVSGQHLTNTGAVFTYCAAGFMVYSALLWEVRRRLFHSSARLATLLGLAICGWSGGQLSLIRLPDIHDLEISCAYFYFALTLFACVRAGLSEHRITGWLSVAALSLSLGVGARPGLVLAVPFLLGFGFWLIRHRGTPRRRAWAFLLGPLVVIGGLLAAFNFARFDSPFEFGIRYQLSTLDRVHQSMFLAERVPYAVYRYLFGGFRLGLYFPFLEGDLPGPIPRPASHDEPSNFYGFLVTTPILLLLAFAGTALRDSRLQGVRRVAWLALATSGAQWLLMLPAGMGAHRYATDLLPPLLMICSLILQAFPWSRVWHLALIPLVLYSSVLGYLQSAALYGIFPASRSPAFTQVAHCFNAPVFLVEHLTRHHPSYPRLVLRLPTDGDAPNEPLLVCGDPGRENFIYVNYAGPDLIRIGVEIMGQGGPVSDFLPVDRTQPHVLELDLGIFYPPPGHPVYSGLDAAGARLFSDRAVIRLDGKVVIDTRLNFHPPHELFQWGKSENDAAFGTRFRGKILESIPVPIRPLGGDLPRAD